MCCPIITHPPRHFIYLLPILPQRANAYKTALTSSCIWLLHGKNVTNFDVNFLDSDVREIRALLSRRQSYIQYNKNIGISSCLYLSTSKAKQTKKKDWSVFHRFFTFNQVWSSYLLLFDEYMYMHKIKMSNKIWKKGFLKKGTRLTRFCPPWIRPLVDLVEKQQHE